MRRVLAFVVLVASVAAHERPAVAAEGDPEGEVGGDVEGEDPRRVRLELALMPMLREQQIEGPDRDDLVTRSAGLALLLSAGYQLTEGLEAALVTQLDAGSVRYARFTRPGPDGPAIEEALVEGGFWELWVTLMVRARLGPVFAELGWSPLILRRDASRTDLPNAAGETDGTFVGSRAVAWTLGVGGEVPLAEGLALTLRLQFRVRYLVSRGGEPLADREESGQMLLWPFVGLRYAL